MTVLINGQPCLDPSALARSCRSIGLSVDWLPKVNKYNCPYGHVPGEANILISKNTLDIIDSSKYLNGKYNLQFSTYLNNDSYYSITIKNLISINCQCLTPGASQSNSAYLMTLNDKRLIDNKKLIDVAFNVRHKFTNEELIQSKTWQECIDYVWNEINLSGDSLLPINPEGLPTDLEYWNTSGIFALSDILSKINCRLCYNPTTEEYTIKLAAANDDDYNNAINKYNKLKIWDDYTRISSKGLVPKYVRIVFSKLPYIRGQNSPYYTIDLSDYLSGSRLWPDDSPEGIITIYDDTPALYNADGSGPNNLDKLQLKATERAKLYFDDLANRIDDAYLVYAAPINDIGFIPNSQVTSVEWSDSGNDLPIPGRGTITTIYRNGKPPTTLGMDREIDPLTEIVRLTGQKNGIYFDAFIQRWDDIQKQWKDRERIWVIDAGSV